MAKYEQYAEYQDSGVEWLGRIPSHWDVVPIKHLAILNPKKSTLSQDLMSDECSFVPMEKLKFNSLVLDEKKVIKDVYDGYTYFENEDILVAKVTPCFENNNTTIAKDLINGVGFGSSEIFVLRVNNKVNNRYLFYRLLETIFISVATAAMTGAGGLRRVPAETINTYSIAVPNIDEQTQIANFLDHETAQIDTLIDKQQTLIQLLKEKRQAVISHAVTKGLNPDAPMKDSGVEWLGDVPEHWEVMKGAFIGQLFGSESVPENQVVKEGILPFIKVSTLSRDGFELQEPEWFVSARVAKNYKTRTSYVVFPKRGAAIFTNKVNVVNEPSLIDPNLMGWQINEKALSKYIALLLKTRKLDDIADVSTVPQINNKHINPEKFPLPPIKEQQEILDYIDGRLITFDDLIDKAEQAIQLMQERRTTLISAAVTGKIDVRGWRVSE